MNTLSALDSTACLPQKLPIAASVPSASSQLVSKPSPATLTAKTDPVSLSDAGLALSNRVDNLGSAAVNMAQNLVTNFARQLFGDAADGMKLSFDSASVSAMSQFSAMVQHSIGSNGSSDAAAMQLEDNVDFSGTGQITTADGHRFNFEVQVHYESVIQETAAASSGTTSSNSQTAASKPKSQVPPAQNLTAHFPGNLADLFRAFNQDRLALSFQFPKTGIGDDKQASGSMKLHLLNLVESPPAIIGKLADAYGVQPNLQKVVNAKEKVVEPLPAANTNSDPSKAA